MIVCLIRHGQALPEMQDPQRHLSDEGRGEVLRVSEFLGRCGLKVSGLYHSGKARAEETAKIIASQTGSAAATAHEGLAPNDDPEAIARVIESWTEDSIIVGHLPHLSRLASLLLVGKHSVPIVNLGCASVLCLEREDDGSWCVNWMVTPALVGGQD